MGRTYRQDNDFGFKRDPKDKQRELRKRNKKLQKQNKQKGNEDADLWLFVQRRGLQ